MSAPDAMKMGRVEFIAFAAMIFATIAFSIDAMLPALPEIAQELSPRDPNRAQLILTSFVLGMGVGTFIAGPLSDTFGRKTIITLGAVLYCAGAFIAWSSSSLEVVLAARVLQGLGAAGPRVVGLAVIRDLYEGRGMAQLMSFVMMVFTLVPAFAPLIGTAIIEIANWRGIFIVFIGFSLFCMTWMHLRLHETLPKDKRRPFRLGSLASAILELLSNRTVRVSIACQTLGFGMLFGMLSSVHQIYDMTFGHADTFPYWFAAIALFSGSASFLNAMLVMRIGMRKMVLASFIAEALFSGAMLLLTIWTPNALIYFGAFLIWQTSIFFFAGLVFGNLNALAMEPMGHIAGMAASLIGGMATVLAMVLAVPVGLLFNGTPQPLAVMMVCASIVGAILMFRLIRQDVALVNNL